MNSPQVGPGTLVLIVGPSGAGKDTLISLASRTCRDDRAIVFPRRIVTRPSSETEDHDSLTMAGFDDALARGHFAFWWGAHGHRYGIPKTIDAEIEAGHVVVCNVSRAIIAGLRERYENVVTVLVTASSEILAARLSGRRRDSDGPLEQRIAQNLKFSELTADVVIENNTSAEAAAAALVTLLNRTLGALERR
ncbi:MAG TPA: phosphonate metabolism protein/1,5-bisphosphokinase (PRPP-forming) PhnN [Pseudolabrys sp.]|nr:phosphonate metabolism protein/1,5-bisphosphokinase (PRPP-forming) PhnN [Pseudolabrys sp.]